MKAGVICSQGIGDVLLMMIASHYLFSRGYQVTTFHSASFTMRSWFPHYEFKLRSSLTNYETMLRPYNLIILQNDNTSLAFDLIDLYKQGKINNLSVFYASYCPNKHRSLTSWDRIFNLSYPMTDNIAQAIASILQTTQTSKNNGLVIPPSLITHRYPKRVLIHPTTTSKDKTWPHTKFLQVAAQLKKRGFEVVFCMSPNERNNWFPLVGHDFKLPLFPTLADLAAYLYESGYLIGNDSSLGHLASNLHIPTLIIGNCYKRLSLWRPGWFQGKIITPSSWIPNVKGWRLRTKKWHHFISSRQVMSAFDALLDMHPLREKT